MFLIQKQNANLFSETETRKLRFGKTNAGITFGSEAWDCSNVIMKDCDFNGAYHVLLVKMRPDTPQQYRNVLADGMRGKLLHELQIIKIRKKKMT